MANSNATLTLEAFKLIADLAARAMEARNRARAVAAAAGVSDADLDAADARFATVYPDPLPPVVTPPPPPPIEFPAAGMPKYNDNVTGPTPSDDVLKAMGFKVTDYVCENNLGQWSVTPFDQLRNPDFRPVRQIK
jgi:hypothetical protein